MNVKIENIDIEKVILITGIDTNKQEWPEMVVNKQDKTKRYTLRPTESGKYFIKEGQFLGIEEL